MKQGQRTLGQDASGFEALGVDFGGPGTDTAYQVRILADVRPAQSAIGQVGLRYSGLICWAETHVGPGWSMETQVEQEPNKGLVRWRFQWGIGPS